MGRTKIYTGFWWGNLKERYHLKDLCLDGRIILKWALNRIGGERYMDSILLAQDRDK
jgi:hypothetical protein